MICLLLLLDILNMLNIDCSIYNISILDVHKNSIWVISFCHNYNPLIRPWEGYNLLFVIDAIRMH